MTGNPPFKPLFRAFWGIVISIILSSCMEPVPVEVFVNSDTIIIYVDNLQENVVIFNETDDPLQPHGDRITGLSQTKYYMVEESVTETAAFVRYAYVGPSGQLSPDLSQIGLVPGRQIVSLNRKHTYRVMDADLFTGTVSYFDEAARPASAAGGTSEAVTGGAITLAAPTNTYFLSPDANITGTVASAARVGIIPSAAGVPLPFEVGTIQLNSTPGTTSDYIFSDYDTTAVTGGQFKVLRVAISAPTSITIDVKWSPLTPNPLVITPPMATITQAQLINDGQLVIHVTATGFDTLSYVWTYQNGDSWSSTDTEVDPSGSLTLPIVLGADPSDGDDKNIELLVPANHQFILEATRGGVPYSAGFTLIVTES